MNLLNVKCKILDIFEGRCHLFEAPDFVDVRGRLFPAVTQSDGGSRMEGKEEADDIPFTYRSGGIKKVI